MLATQGVAMSVNAGLRGQDAGTSRGLRPERSMDQTETNRSVGALASNAFSLWKGNSTRNANRASMEQVSINAHVVACKPF